MSENPPIDPERLKELEEALVSVRKALARIESPETGRVDYSEWSEARGSRMGDWICAPKLKAEHLDNCTLVASRYALLSKLKKQARVAEIGTQYGQFARHIVKSTDPSQLHLFDLSFRNFPADDPDFKMVELHLHEGDSSELIKRVDGSFDWVYLDADHQYAGVRKDLGALADKIAPGGMIICNDYTQWSILEARLYGVPKAVHEFCLSENWGFRYMALHPWGYHDVALQRLDEMR